MTEPAVERPERPPIAVLDIDAADIDRHPDLIRRISDGSVTVALVRGVFPGAAAAEIVGRVEAGEGSSRLVEVAPQFGISSLGLALDTAETLDQYLSEARSFVPECARIFRGLFDYGEWVAGLVTRFAGGRAIAIPTRADDPYNPVTIRRLPADAFIPPHCETEQLNRPAYTHLKGLIGASPIISYYTTLRPPQQGGEVRVSTMLWGDVPLSPDGRSDAAAVIDRYESVTLLPGVGDFILFDGGRHYHQVLPVGGGYARWTIGGFLCESADQDRIWYWS